MLFFAVVWLDVFSFFVLMHLTSVEYVVFLCFFFFFLVFGVGFTLDANVPLTSSEPRRRRRTGGEP